MSRGEWESFFFIFCGAGGGSPNTCSIFLPVNFKMYKHRINRVLFTATASGFLCL